MRYLSRAHLLAAVTGQFVELRRNRAIRIYRRNAAMRMIIGSIVLLIGSQQGFAMGGFQLQG